MTAYREVHCTCPTCPDRPALREFQTRWVCDECGGMLVAVADFQESLREIDGAFDELEFSDEQPGPEGKSECPRCHARMHSCVIARGKLKLVGAFLHCAADGIWFPRDALTAIFARVSRRTQTFFGGRRAVLGNLPGSAPNTGSVTMPGASSSVTTMASIANAFAGSRELAHAWRRGAPRVHTLYVSTHKGERLGCPSCKETALTYGGDRWPCETCSGVFVETAALIAMISDVTNRPWEPPTVAGGPGERPCPVCGEAMLVEVFEAVTVDHCKAHGVWFDEDELQATLQHAIEGDPSSTGGWLKKLFHRHGTTES